MNADTQIAAMIDRLRGLRDFTTEAAREAAPLVENVVKGTAAAGTTPEGKAWPAKRDGSRALPDVVSAIAASAVGTAVVVILKGGAVFHHYMKGASNRRVLPDSGAGIPRAIADAMHEGARRTFARFMGGRR